MNSTKFKSVCELMFGRSWQSQVADYLMISRKTVSSWLDRESVPAWVDSELKPLVARRAKEAQFAFESISMSNDDFLHENAILSGKVFHYDIGRYSFDDIKKFILNQKWTVLDSAKHLIRQGETVESVLSWVEEMFHSVDDIADFLERNQVAEDDLDEIKYLRGNACSETKREIQDIFEKLKT